MNRIRIALLAWKHLGPSWVAYRTSQALRAKLGHYERILPLRILPDLRDVIDDGFPADPQQYLVGRRLHSANFFFVPADRALFAPLLKQCWPASAAANRAESLLAGDFSFFNSRVARAGFPPDWHRNVFSAQAAPKEPHWSRISDFAFGDIKLIWELNRFSSVFTLVRAYWRTGDERYAEGFWQLIESWAAENPPNAGANWKCGQECSLRVMAWIFGFYGFLDAAATTPLRAGLFARLIAASGERIAAHIGYALSQRNNHGVSEAAGLWTIGLLFPELKHASVWRDTGRNHLEQLGRELIYDDGAFSQHSANYHRVMLHAYLWSIRLGELNNKPLSSELLSRVARAGDFLFQIQDETTGKVPRYGQNDGALILPLNDCPDEDYRPVINGISYLSSRKARYAPGPWTEDLLWIFGTESLHASVTTEPRVDFDAPLGGCRTLRSPLGFAFIRCPRFRDRPAQADALHVDLWWRGINIAIDPGTFSYNAPPPWNNPLAGTAFHNTVTVDQRDQMDRVSKFLWLPWLKTNTGVASPHLTKAPADFGYWEGAHDGYHRLTPPASHHRAVLRLPGEAWLIVDRLASSVPREYRLHWLLPNAPHQSSPDGRLRLLFPQAPIEPYYVNVLAQPNCKSNIQIADSDSPRGWFAPHYFDRQPAISFSATVSSTNAWFCSLFAPQDLSLRWLDSSCALALEGPDLHATFSLRDDRSSQGRSPLVATAAFV